MIKKLFQKRHTISTADAADWGILAAGLTVFSTVALWTINKSSLWFDEAFGAYLIRFDFFEIARYTANDVHPPLYYWLLKLWSLLFGTSELGLRSMSVFFAGVGIVFGFLLVRRLFGRRAAWVSLLFMIVAPMLVRYGQEARMYALVTAISLAATYVLTIAMDTKKRLPWIVYGVLVGLGMWTHYFTAVVWIAHWVWRAWVVRQTKKKTQVFVRAFFSKQWVFAHILAIGLYIPWLPFFVYQILNVQVNGFWILPVTPSTFTNFFTNILFYQDQETVNPWVAMGFFVILLSVIALAICLYRTQTSEQRRNYLLLFALGFVPAILLFILSMPPLQSSFVDRYLIPSALGVSLFMGVTVAASVRFIRPLYSTALIVLITGAMVFGVTNVYQLGNYNKTLHRSNNTQQIIEMVAAHAPAGQPIIADSPWLFYEAAFYSTTAHPVYFIDATIDYRYGSLDMLQYNDQHKIKDLPAFMAQHPIVWYLGRPGESELIAPHSAWKKLQQVNVNDSVSNVPSYKAIQYQTN